VRGWLRSSKFLERWSVKAPLYVIKFFYCTFFCYCLLHWLKRPTLQSESYIISLYMFHIMKYFFVAFVLFLNNQHLGLSCERLHMAKLDDCSILQPRHLVQNRLGGMHDSISIQTLRSHSFACGCSQAMCHMTKEHLAWRDLRKTRASRGTQYPTTLEDLSLWMSG
jgi:hypothetical protein